MDWLWCLWCVVVPVVPLSGLLGVDGVRWSDCGAAGVSRGRRFVLLHVTPPRRAIIDAGARGDAGSTGLLDRATEICAENFRCSTNCRPVFFSSRWCTAGDPS